MQSNSSEQVLWWTLKRLAFRSWRKHGSDSARERLFHSFGARRANCLGRVDFCPEVFSEGSVSVPVLAELMGGACMVRSGFEGMEVKMVGPTSDCVSTEQCIAVTDLPDNCLPG